LVEADARSDRVGHKRPAANVKHLSARVAPQHVEQRPVLEVAPAIAQRRDDVAARKGASRAHRGLGNDCSSVAVSANKSPSRSTRSSTSDDSNDSGSPSAVAATSSHVTGVDTVGVDFARSEYGAIVVL